MFSACALLGLSQVPLYLCIIMASGSGAVLVDNGSEVVGASANRVIVSQGTYDYHISGLSLL